MPFQYEIIHLFRASSGYVAEVKRLDQPEDAPKVKLYQWLWIEDGTVMSLSFVDMVTAPEQTRTFEEAHLRFDSCQGELRWNDGRVAPLVVKSASALPTTLQWLVHEHLN